MPVAFLASTTLASGAGRTTSTLTIPTGASAGSAELRMIVNAGNSGATAPTITPPANVTLVASVTYGDGTYTVRNSTYRYRCTGTDPASFAFTHGSATTNGGVLSYTGVDATADDVAASTNSAATGTAAIATGVTTVTANTFLVAVRGSWDGVAITAPSGYTERIDLPVSWAGDSLRAATGATGNVTIPHGNGGNTSPWSAILMALRPAPTVTATRYRRIGKRR